MAQQIDFKKVNLFTGIIFNNEIDVELVVSRLESKFSGADIVSKIMDFDFTDYYSHEMGKQLKRMFISFKELVSPDLLPEIKIITNEMEKEFARKDGRIVNLDPGYISDANVIIATAKNYYQRIPLRNGIYAHMEYVIKGKDFHFLEWTYPDFKSKGYLIFFKELLTIYKKKSAMIRG